MSKIRISDIIRQTAEEINVQKALKEVLSKPGWEQEIKDWYRNNKSAGLGKGLAIPLSMAILTLSQALNATTPKELISKIKDTAGIEQSVSAPKSDSILIDTVSKMLPYPVTGSELKILKTGGVPFRVFKWTLEGKIRRGMKSILSDIKKDPSFYGVSDSSLADIVVKAFLKNVQDQKNSEAKEIVTNYLKDEGDALEILAEIAKETVLPVLQGASHEKGHHRVQE